MLEVRLDDLDRWVRGAVAPRDRGHLGARLDREHLRAAGCEQDRRLAGARPDLEDRTSPSRTRASSSTSSTSCSGYVGRLASYSSATSPNTSRLRVVAIDFESRSCLALAARPALGSTSLTGAMARVTRTAAQVACALTVAVMLIPGSPARAGVMRIGRRPVVPVGAVAKGAVAPRLRLHVTVTLKPRNPAALNAYAEAVSTPGSRVLPPLSDPVSVRAPLRRNCRPRSAQCAAACARRAWTRAR